MKKKELKSIPEQYRFLMPTRNIIIYSFEIPNLKILSILFLIKTLLIEIKY
jgi:hypothetical protein